MVKRSEFNDLVRVAALQQEALDRQLKMIVDLVRLNQLTNDRLVYLEGEVNGN